jgi:hypothetical protein
MVRTLRRRGVGVLPHAQPRALDRRAGIGYLGTPYIFVVALEEIKGVKKLKVSGTFFVLFCTNTKRRERSSFYALSEALDWGRK